MEVDEEVGELGSGLDSFQLQIEPSAQSLHDGELEGAVGGLGREPGRLELTLRLGLPPRPPEGGLLLADIAPSALTSDQGRKEGHDQEEQTRALIQIHFVFPTDRSSKLLGKVKVRDFDEIKTRKRVPEATWK